MACGTESRSCSHVDGGLHQGYICWERARLPITREIRVISGIIALPFVDVVQLQQKDNPQAMAFHHKYSFADAKYT